MFKLNDEPIHTEQDGDFHFLALIDAASCFILSSMPVPAKTEEPTQLDSKRLLREGKSHKRRWPRTLFVPTEQPAQFLVAEAKGLNIEVVLIAEEQLLPIIGEAQEDFRHRFGNRGAQ